MLALLITFSSGCGKKPSSETKTAQTTPSAPASASVQPPNQPTINRDATAVVIPPTTEQTPAPEVKNDKHESIATPRDYSPYYQHTNAIFASATFITSPEVLLKSKNPEISQPEYRDFISKTLAAHPTNTLVVVCCRLNLPPSNGFVPGAHTLVAFCSSVYKPGDLDADIVKTNPNESGMFTVKDMYGIEDGVRVNPERPPHDDAHLAIYDSFLADGNGGLTFIMVFVADKQPQNLNIGVKGVIFLEFSFK